ncbi:MAG: ABC transporter ATP-binding protein [Alphaproteobacteria bacterium]|nr:ABC transporter ATP-binding protein [Alphaproteobacteria bacterium]
MSHALTLDDTLQGLRGILRIVRAHGMMRQLTMMALLFLAGMVEGIGWASLLPLVSVAMGSSGGSSQIDMLVRELLALVGLEPDLGSLLLVVVACMAAKAALMIAAMSYVGFMVAAISNELRVELIERLLHARWSYFIRHPVGRFATSIGHESNRAALAYKAAVRFLIDLIQCAIYLVIAFLYSWRVALLALLVGGVISIIMHRVTRMARRAGGEQTMFIERLVSRLNDVVTGIKPLKAMDNYRHIRALLRSDADRVNRAVEDIVFSQEAADKIPDLLIILFLAATFYLAINFWQLDAAPLVVVGLLMVKTISQMSRAQRQVQIIAISEAAYFSIRRTIEEAGRQREVSTGLREPRLETGITFVDVSFAYATRPVLRDVNLEVPAGRITTIIGTSGAGKTTIADLILGLHRPDRGEILIDGAPLEEFDLDSWRGAIGYVPQDVMLFHDTILENVTLGDATLSRADVEQALREAGAYDFVAGLPGGLDYVVGERGGRLSGGQRQRIALARALVHRPKLLVLDEATSALDPETEAEICNNVRAQAGRLTILAITHKPAWVDIADRVYRVLDAEVREIDARQAHSLQE